MIERKTNDKKSYKKKNGWFCLLFKVNVKLQLVHKLPLDYHPLTVEWNVSSSNTGIIYIL